MAVVVGLCCADERLCQRVLFPGPMPSCVRHCLPFLFRSPLLFSFPFLFFSLRTTLVGPTV